jgi:hypothetical protein
MKSRLVLSLSTLLGLGVAGLLSSAGCSSSSTPADTTPVDSGVADTKPDTKPPPVETGPTLCDETALPSGFTCNAPPTTAGSTACTPAAIEEWATACVGTSWPTQTPATCAAWQAKYPDCFTCTKTWSVTQSGIVSGLYPDRDKCYFAVLRSKAPASLGDCAKSVQCSFDCQQAVCGACDTTPPDPTNPNKTDFGDCVNRALASGAGTKPKGLCYDPAGKVASQCLASVDINSCIIREAQ